MSVRFRGLTHSARMTTPAGLNRSLRSCHCIVKGSWGQSEAEWFPLTFLTKQTRS
jgi:hypothetical protein